MSQNHNPPLVLVVDDEIAAATMLKHVFEREGYTVHLAADGKSALAIAREKLPNLILLDIQMPQMDGFEVLRQLRENPRTAAIPTIVVSARARKPSDIAHGLNIGADDYIAKPFAPQELLARARSKMRARQLEESLQQRTQELEILLRISEELNKHLELSELLSLVLFFTLDLIPGEVAFVVQYDETGKIGECRIQKRHTSNVTDNERTALQSYVARISEEEVWDDANSPTGYRWGMVYPLTHGNNQMGSLLVASNQTSFSQNHQMLFQGITRQTSLALHNAALYKVQANYALHLEETVAERTRELQQTQQMLFRSEKLASIGHLAASIAHEINNPLQPIQLNLEYLLDDADAQQPIDKELVLMTQSSVQRISRIVRQLLEFTKSSSDTAVSETDVQETLKSVIQLNQRVLERNRIRVVQDFKPTPRLRANKDQLEQVFMNIILNAKAAMEDNPDGGVLNIRLWDAGDAIKLQFEDNGSGIPSDIIHKIFDPFVSTKNSGTGLGLFVTYGIIEKHQGHIEVESKIDEGTTFTITLPHRSPSPALSDNAPG